MNESKYRKRLEDRIDGALPGCFILRNPASEYQGIPDLTVFYGPRWGMLEIKISPDAPFQPNQEYYIKWMDEMSFAAVIYPENEEAVLGDLIMFLEESWVQ